MRRVAVLSLVVAMTSVLAPTLARADAVDEAFAEGNRAVARQDWVSAIDAYERAGRLLPQPNATLAYNLGTAHAENGDLGRATYYLRWALDDRAAPDVKVAELARQNLAEVRRRAEIAATAHDAQIDRPATWWDVMLEGLRQTWVGWASLLAGLAFLGVWRLERRRGRARGPLQATMLVLVAVYLVAGALHAAALRADAVAPEAIVLGDRVEVRVRPGAHADASFSVQGGARVRITDRSPGWREVRLPGGLSGWMPERDVGELAAGRPVAPSSRPVAPDSGKAERGN